MSRTKHLTYDRIAGEILTSAVVCQIILVSIYWVDVITGARIVALHNLFDLDGEGNIPAWFSSAQLLFVALAFWTHALRQPQALRPSKAFFLFAGCTALYASMDEAGQLHEQVTMWMGHRYVDWLPNYAGKHFWWVMLVVAIAVGLFQLVAADLLTLWRLHRRFLILATLGIAIGLSGCMGVETLGYKLLHGERTSLWYKLEVTIEEWMEMLGASLILFATLRLNHSLARARLRHDSDRSRSRARISDCGLGISDFV